MKFFEIILLAGLMAGCGSHNHNLGPDILKLNPSVSWEMQAHNPTKKKTAISVHAEWHFKNRE